MRAVCARILLQSFILNVHAVSPSIYYSSGERLGARRLWRDFLNKRHSLFDGYRNAKSSFGSGRARRRATLACAGCPRAMLYQRGQGTERAYPELRQRCGRDHPFITCSTSLDNALNVPPGPGWWQHRVCIDVAHPAGTHSATRTVLSNLNPKP